ncbi:hypothetical protein H6G97_40315 [Nostoc flagelliforme FACHB-838]|uniref:Uncharacterized protein n=1 Tax=Nostoc flagelliforme FACHB-838 TaxID=2692904 RepID=A0ABR8E1F6_9NOSO|nr:hypothetical protein [Nostoc flagelliforme]MBD2535313.1 hypothetical protein [Nostoc flagelliforme FACHB-838]
MQADPGTNHSNQLADTLNNRSVVESTLVDALPQLTERLTQYRHQIEREKITLNYLESAINYLAQPLSSQTTVDAIAENKIPTITKDNQK